MELTVSRDSLIKISLLGSAVAQKKSSMPILSNVLIQASEEGWLMISATDLDTSLKASTSAQVKVSGSIVIDAKVFHDVVKELPDYPVTLSAQKKNRLEVQCGQTRFKINGVAGAEYPTISGVDLVDPSTLSVKTLIEMIDKTLFAVCTDETRYNISGVLAETFEGPLGPNKKCLRFVSTDGHRLALIDRPAEGFELDKPIILPRKALQDLKKALEESGLDRCQLCVANGQLTVGLSGTNLGIRLKETNFPDYRTAIPNETSTKVVVERTILTSAIKRVSLATNEKSKAVKLKLNDGNLVISSASTEFGEASDTMDVEQEGSDFTSGFSAKFLLEMLSAMNESDKITLRLDGDSSPAVFSGNSDELYENVVMPMRFE